MPSATDVVRQKVCPKCGGPVHLVERGPYSPLNQDQFDAVKAGDYYCKICPDNDRGRTAYCYWWEHELPPAENWQI